ncbi:hypothetical protein GTP41_07720 [Pseudoduganella sp. DS3]|uniref:Uncharacterized protein n=1 Tax=Pseudoduganella guangdongensis TaxID=2692179 RepID=A0A6N9HF17_9BURK|nr:hypothetical protein [Pseudoduganella guangdongensis]
MLLQLLTLLLLPLPLLPTLLLLLPQLHPLLRLLLPLLPLLSNSFAGKKKPAFGPVFFRLSGLTIRGQV